MPFEAVVSDDNADLELLKLANERGKFALQIGASLHPHMQFAFERGIDAEWFTLVDVSHIYVAGGVFRVFRLTRNGWERLKALKAQFNLKE